MNAGTLNTRNIIRRNTHAILSFLLPVIIFIAAFRAAEIYPFGPKTVLISDMSGQYIDFYTALYRMLKSNGSLFYSWQAGMGHNFTGIYAYYLSSPFSFIILLFKEQDLNEALYLMILLKIGSAGMTFSVYLKYLYKKLNNTIIIFSTMYALMSYCVVYSFNVMWLDGVIMLPIVLIGVEEIIKRNRYPVFIASLTVTFIANFYISYMVGVFSFLYFTAAFYSEYSLEIKVFMKKFKIFILSAALSAGSAAFLMIPTFFALKNGLGMPETSIFYFGINFNPLGLLYKLPAGVYDTLTVGLPNIYCGILALIMSSLFFLNKSVGNREKRAYAFLLIFMLLSFILSNMNLMWHGFDAPNWFPYRYSFLFSFIILNMSAKCFNAIDGINIRMVLITSGVWMFIFLITSTFFQAMLTNKMLIINVIFMAVYAVLLLTAIKSYSKVKIIISVILLFVIAENFVNVFYLISGMDKEFGYISKENYKKSLAAVSDLVHKIEEKDKSFYRIDRTNGVGRSFNDSMNLNYKGIAHFSSMINGRLNNFLNRVGFTTPVAQAVEYCGATPVTDSLLGIKYVLSDKVYGFGYDEILNERGIKAYKNKYSLPIGFAAGNGILNLQVQNNNPFDMQNELLSEAAAEEKASCFLPLSSEIKKLENVKLSIDGSKQKFEKIDKKKEGFVELEITNTNNQQVYCYLPNEKLSIIDVYVNGNFLENYLHFYNNTILNLGYHSRDEKIKIKLVLKEESFTILNRYFYGLDGKYFDKVINNLKSELFEVSQMTNTSVKGKILLNDNKVLFTSIPYDKGWSVIVDGKKAEISNIAGAFIGVELSKGVHEVTFSFVPRGLTVGVIISCLSVIMLFNVSKIIDA